MVVVQGFLFPTNCLSDLRQHLSACLIQKTGKARDPGPGAGCSKLTTLLVNVELKFQVNITNTPCFASLII